MTESNVQPFEFKGNPVATVTTGNGTVLFCAKHVATALGYSNTNDAIRKHCRHIDGVANRYPITDSLGRTQQAVFLTEGDVYRLIASSKLTSAVEFEHWLFDEVASFLGVSKGSLYVWPCHDKWGGRYPPAPKRVGRRLVWNPQEVIDYRDRRCAISRRELVHGE